MAGHTVIKKLSMMNWCHVAQCKAHLLLPPESRQHVLFPLMPQQFASVFLINI